MCVFKKMSDASRSAQVHDGSHCHLSAACTCMLEKHQHQERLSALDLHRKQSVLPSLPHADRGYAVLIWSKCVWPGGINGSATNISGYSKAMTTKAWFADSGASRGRTGKGGARNHRKELAQGTSNTPTACVFP